MDWNKVRGSCWLLVRSHVMEGSGTSVHSVRDYISENHYCGEPFILWNQRLIGCQSGIDLDSSSGSVPGTQGRTFLLHVKVPQTHFRTRRVFIESRQHDIVGLEKVLQR